MLVHRHPNKFSIVIIIREKKVKTSMRIKLLSESAILDAKGLTK